MRRSKLLSRCDLGLDWRDSGGVGGTRCPRSMNRHPLSGSCISPHDDRLKCVRHLPQVIEERSYTHRFQRAPELLRGWERRLGWLGTSDLLPGSRT